MTDLSNESTASESTANESTAKNAKHKKAMEKQKAKVDARVDEASIERGVLILLTGNGKGKSSSAFGMAWTKDFKSGDRVSYFMHF